MTKRRKVWVNLYEDHPNHEWTAHPSKEAAMQERYQDNFGVRYGRTARCIEARPGDVVLSREEVEARAYAAARYLRDRGLTGVGAHAVDAVADLVAQFIRGGR